MAVKYIPISNKEQYETLDWGYKPHILPAENFSVALVTEAPTYDSSFKRAEEIVANVTQPIKEEEKEAQDVVKSEDIKSEVKKPSPQITDKKKNFIETLTPVYEKALKERGIDSRFAKFLVAQDGLESGWDLKETRGYNIGNITTGDSWKGQSEIRGDKDSSGQRITQRFRVYNNLSDYVADKINLLAGSRYNSFAVSPTIENFADSLIKGGYATDPNYRAKILNVFQSLQAGGVLEKAKKEVKEGYRDRAHLLQRNAWEAYGFMAPKESILSYLYGNIDRAKGVMDSAIKEEGLYDPIRKIITLRDPDAAVHEVVHASHPTPQVDSIKKLIDYLQGDILKPGYSHDDYLDDPDEIYASWIERNRKAPSVVYSTMTTRTTDGKGNYNFVVTKFDKEGNVLASSPLLPGHRLIPEEAEWNRVYSEEDSRLGRYNDKFLDLLERTIAYNPTLKDSQTLMAKVGLKIK